jgi:cytochrome c biogenesis protein CcdA
MTWGTLLFLGGLALVDSTSVGTLLIPLWMLLDPKVRVPQFLAYLATVAGFYFVVGVVLTAGAGSLRGLFAGAAANDAVNWAQLALGVLLFAASFWFDPKRAARRRSRRGGPDPAQRWQARLAAARASYRTTVALGVVAAGIEVMSMLPYLAAVGVLTASGAGVAVWLPVLGAYVLVMVLPALVLLGVRLAVHQRAEPVLRRLSGWMGRHMDGVVGWVLAIIGFLLARDAAAKLGLFGMAA